ncbi:MAG: MFS transporter [Pyrobaculum sp.]
MVDRDLVLSKEWKYIMPVILIAYLLAFIDRVNIGVAGLAMQKDLGLTQAELGLAAGIFFIGYFILEIPGTYIVERWSARK